MIASILCVCDQGGIKVLDAEKIAKFKKRLHQGQPVQMYLDDEKSMSEGALFKKFHALRDEYAKKTGYDNAYSKAELKHLYGVVIPYGPGFMPPLYRGRFVEIYKNIEYQKSTLDYTTEELQRLIQGAERAIDEAGI